MATTKASSATAGRVSVIPATKRAVQAGGQIRAGRALRVAAYCRVSTGDESQQTSYTRQCAYYTELIRKKQEWSMAGIFADEAISGTSRAKRKQFNRMMDEALAGKIDYIVTKSISRFARNTVDTLNCVRQLRNQNPPVGVYFEKENIDTLDAKGELILTILSALAQDESRSLSDNIRWTFQKNFREGKPHINLKRMIGYDKGPNGEWLIHPEQAEIVRTIFERFLRGNTAAAIAKYLNAHGKTTVNGKIWRSDSVLDVLRNEKFVGDLEMQKTITKDFLTHESIINRGEAPRYYVTDHHAGIVDRLTWEKTQAILLTKEKKREENKQKKIGPTAHALSNMVCGECGGQYRRTAYTARIANFPGKADAGSIYSFNYTIWRCEKKYQGHAKKGRLAKEEKEAFEKQCASPIIYDIAVQQSIMEMLYGLKREYEARGSDSQFAKDFQFACDSLHERARGTGCAARQREIPEQRIGNWREQYPQMLEEQDDVAMVLKRNFDFFVKCLLNLPEVNRAGMKLNVNGVDVDGSLFVDRDGNIRPGKRGLFNAGRLHIDGEKAARAPDLLEFDQRMYISFFPSAIVRGDAVELTTNFGIRLTCKGIRRTLGAFIGFRRCLPDGQMEIMTENWQVNGKSVQCRHVEKKRKP